MAIDVTVGSAVTVGSIDCGGYYPQSGRGTVKSLTGAGPITLNNNGGTEDHIGDAASVYMKSAGNHIKIRLDADVNETVSALYFDGVKQPNGTWGSEDSGADNKNNTYQERRRGGGWSMEGRAPSRPGAFHNHAPA